MKMIGHQTIGKNLTMRFYFISNSSQKMQVIFSTKKNLLPIITSVINVVYPVCFKIHLFPPFVFRDTLCVARIRLFSLNFFGMYANSDTHSVPRWIDPMHKDNKNYQC